MNKFRAVKGILPKYLEIPDWSSDKIMALLMFASLALRERMYKGKMQMAFTIDKQFRDATAQYDNPFFEEFLVRLDIKDFSKFSIASVGRLSNMVRTVLSYVKSNPHLVTEEMEILMRSTERFSWALANFKSETSKIGAEIVVVDNLETTQLDRHNAQPLQSNLTLPEVQYHQSLLKMTSILNSLLKGIKVTDLKDLSLIDRLKISIPLMKSVSGALNTKKSTSLVFKKLVINTANKDDLEKAVLDYAQTQDN